MSQPLLVVVRFLHDLFTAVWIGGLITFGLSLLPAARSVLGMGPELRQLVGAFQKRHSVLVYVSIIGLVITGLPLAKTNPQFQGLFRFGNPFGVALAVKHIAVLLMIGLALYRSLVLARRPGPSTPAGEKLSMILVYANVALGALVLFLSSLGAVLA